MNEKFKYDLHIHTKEGSLDAKEPIADVLSILESKGFSGVVITDHNSYKGYETYKKNNIKTSLSVLKGIEYDTSDAGHMLIIMPSGVDLKILTYRGFSLKVLIDIVHSNGGIIGAAHPYYDSNLGIAKTFKYKNKLNILNELDFIEGFNAAEPYENNEAAKLLAKKYNLPISGGSDSHKLENVGKAYTLFNEKINNEDELISYIKNHKPTKVDGELYKYSFKNKSRLLDGLLWLLYWLWNKILVLIYYPIRKLLLNKLK